MNIATSSSISLHINHNKNTIKFIVYRIIYYKNNVDYRKCYSVSYYKNQNSELSIKLNRLLLSIEDYRQFCGYKSSYNATEFIKQCEHNNTIILDNEFITNHIKELIDYSKSNNIEFQIDKNVIKENTIVYKSCREFH